jgi:molybdopterin molybdotransferase
VQLGVNKAIRIFTGAPLPSGADTVVMQEKITVKDRTLIIGDNELQKGTNVRKIGSEIAKGTLALQKSTKLTPGAIGFLATIGLSEVPVYRLPKVSIIVTGNEIQQPGTALQHGQVYECNSFTLRAGLQQLKIRDVQVEHAEDQPAVIQDIITRFILTSDVVLITGGVSVGDYDFVTPALRQIGVEQIFHKIKQRPGKPLYFGKKGKTLIFGLPGNPSSVLTCYYEYVVPALEKLMQMPESTIITTMLPLASPYSKKTGLSHFLKGYCAGKNVCVLTAQESYKLYSFAKANCLIFLPEEIEEFKKDDMVEVHIFPNN